MGALNIITTSRGGAVKTVSLVRASHEQGFRPGALAYRVSTQTEEGFSTERPGVRFFTADSLANVDEAYMDEITVDGTTVTPANVRETLAVVTA